VKVGRAGGVHIVLAAGVAYRFEGCAFRDILANGQGNAVALAVDMSDTIEERFAKMHPLQPVVGQVGKR
jgi:hypothetical protein